MKKLLTILLFLLFSCVGFAQEKLSFKEITLTEFFKLIEEEPTDTLSLKNAFILSDSSPFQGYRFQPDVQKDTLQAQDTLHIRKYLNLENVVFQPFAQKTIKQVVFHKKVIFRNVFAVFTNVYFMDGLSALYTGNVPKMLDVVFNDPRIGYVRFGTLRFTKCIFDKDPRILAINAGNDNFLLNLDNSTFNGVESSAGINLSGLGRIFIRNNTFHGDEQFRIFLPSDNSDIRIEDNDFGDRFVNLIIRESLDETVYKNNIHNYVTGLSLPESIQNIDIEWNQFKGGIINIMSLFDFSVNDTITEGRTLIAQYKDSIRIANASAYRAEIKLLGTFVSLYRRQFDMEFGNNSYIALKDLETQRLEYLYDQNPSFDTYFEWKVNQFLKVFSDYGTRPSKAIIMSVYVILIFALVYLFFPNSWDRHGKNRIVDRYNFFFKYMKRKAGIHEVYMEDQKEELMSYEQFKANISNSKQKVPKFFTATALPLYKWAVSGTKLSAGVLRRIDIMQGSWDELPNSKRIWKSILLIGAFMLAIVYDIIIKILNALMLSINTFTTLGFGEIPIKGLPRYLAIVQGFIGWFMLTIFSVSLISQLLN